MCNKLLWSLDNREAFRFRLETIVRGQANSRSSEAVPRAQPTHDWRHHREAANAAQRPAQVSEASLQSAAPSPRDEPERSEYLERPAPVQTDESESTENDMELRELLGRYVFFPCLLCSRCTCLL